MEVGRGGENKKRVKQKEAEAKEAKAKERQAREAAKAAEKAAKLMCSTRNQTLTLTTELRRPGGRGSRGEANLVPNQQSDW